MAGDPIAQIQMCAGVTLRPFELFEHTQRPQTACSFIRIEEGIDRRYRIRQHIADRHRQQAMGVALAKLQKAPVIPAADQELFELVRAVVVHAATAMACTQIALVQIQIFGMTGRRDNVRIHIDIACQTAALAAIRAKRGDWNAHRHAGAATATTGAIDDVAAAPKAPFQRHWVVVGQTRIARVEH